MTEEANKAIVQRLYDAMNTQDMGVIDEVVAEDWVCHRSMGSAPTGTTLRGREVFKQAVLANAQAFPDAVITIDDILADGNKVAFRLSMKGTFTGSFRGIQPTNQPVSFWGINIYHIVDGQLVESWERIDTLGLMQQLGVIPTK